MDSFVSEMSTLTVFWLTTSVAGLPSSAVLKRVNEDVNEVAEGGAPYAGVGQIEAG